ncbi:formyltransferase family protein [Natronobacterium gregoryi]|uniref:Methionyl-tRNA formyltransferase n=2 Tax=Natronobacterium gregoryi TaxID=44930 RepID=L0AI52_NATGS|nr:formyltransferase family protein [Natronobacterium gregoryi]AFZ73583.1 methionyl-tRNA formyltransferase [Natronobacterium gregoryi SP2]ELY68145.1 methionyl-tRNA formyltransferase-like protein [Natronobacterium gregoryi SP2]PLK20029.1 methionyl-tRNA formyltransferase [Natronobacterium gregoryi SP2]SFJ34966.1 Formyl transferase [Natronobacterium gregoryi]
MSAANPTTVGVLTEAFLYEWQVRAIERLREQPGVELSLVVQNAANTDDEDESWNSKDRLTLADVREFVGVSRKERAWTFVLAERTLGRLLGDEQPLWHRHSVENVDALADIDRIECTPVTADGWNELPDDAVDELAERCDIVVRFGFGLVRGDVLTAPEHGVVSFHPADIREYRGLGPPAIFHDGQARAGSTLQRLDESIDGGEIVAYEEVSLEDCYTLWDVFDRLATVQIRLLAEGVGRFEEPTFEPESVPDHRLGDFYYRKQRRSLPFATRVLAKNVAGRVRKRLERHETAGERPSPDSRPETEPRIDARE